jgi:predicted DCC family thiol-disulfide oxidoreductase YuxK
MERIILFDGSCNFCDLSVEFIIKRDPKGVFKFASLQSDIGKELLYKHNVPEDIDSIVLIEGKKCYLKSLAALRISKKLKGFWKLSYVFIVVPNKIRDLLYDFIAKNRYKWFGKNGRCMIPSLDEKKRFL